MVSRMGVPSLLPEYQVLFIKVRDKPLQSIEQPWMYKGEGPSILRTTDVILGCGQSVAMDLVASQPLSRLGP